MSRRKQKRPRHLLSAILGTSRLLQRDEPLALKSLTSTLANNSSCSSSSSKKQSCQSSLGLDPSVERLTRPTLPTASHSISHISCHLSQLELISVIPQSRSSSHSTSQCISTIPSTAPSTPNHIPTLMASPKLGVSVTTSSSSSSSAVSLCVPPHPRSPSPMPAGPPSPVTPSASPNSAPPTQACTPVSIAVILEELRVLQQRQIHQMQMTEEICRQVLRLGGASCEMDSAPFMLAPLPQLCLKGSDSNLAQSRPHHSPPASSVAPLLACFSSLLPSQTTFKSSKNTHPLLNVLRPHKTQGDSGVINPANFTSHASAHFSTSSSMSTPIASNIPLALSLGLQAQNSYEKSSNISGASGQSSLTFPNQALTAAAAHSAPTQDTKLSAQEGAGPMRHPCRFCRKLFSSDSSLQIHLRSHTGERPYQCPVCFSRFTTRGNLKVHFLRHREQNPELSFSLFPCSLFASVTGGSMGGPSQAQTTKMNVAHKQQAGDDFCGEGPEGAATSQNTTASSLPLPASIDLALLTTAHSLLQLNRASAAVASTSSGSLLTPSTSSSLASTLLSAQPSSTFSIAGMYKGVKQQHFDENTPPIPTLLPHSAYSQLANLPKLFFPASTTHHQPGHGFLRPTTTTGSFMSTTQQHISFPLTASSTATSVTTPTSDTSKLQRLVEKLEKEPRGQSHWVTSTGETSTSSVTGALSYSSSSLMSTSTFSTNVVTSLPSSTMQIPSSLFNKQSPYLGLMNSAGALAPNQCSVCLRVLSCPRALRLHQATHLGERPFPCKLCGRSFSTKGSLRAHLATHRARPPNSRAQNSCPLCQRKFTNALVLQHHIRMHLGGQLPPENLPDTLTQCDSLPKSQSAEPPASETSPSTNDIQLSNTVPDSRCSFSSHSDLLAVSTAPTICPLTSSLPGSFSPGLFDLNLDLYTIPTTHSPPTSIADDSDLFVGVPSPVDSAASIVPPISTTSDPTPTGEPSFELSSNTASLGEKKNSSSSASVKASAHRDDSEFKSENRLPIPCTGSRSNLEDLLSVQTDKEPKVPRLHPATTPPSLLPFSTESLSSHTLSLVEPDLVQTSESLSQDFSKEEKMDDRKHKTPKTSQRATPDLSSNVNVVSEILDNMSDDASETVPKEPEAKIQRTIKDGHCSSIANDEVEVKDTMAIEKESTEPAVCMSMAPSLPPPMPERKTYHCSECGKEYASRSGLKGHMKHHGGVVRAHRAPARTKGPDRVSQTHHSSHLPSEHQ